jgi:hypothetical protein
MKALATDLRNPLPIAGEHESSGTVIKETGRNEAPGQDTEEPTSAQGGRTRFLSELELADALEMEMTGITSTPSRNGNRQRNRGR